MPGWLLGLALHSINSLVSWFATIEAQVVLHAVLMFFFRELASSLFLFKGGTASLGGVNFCIGSFSGQFSDTWA